MRDSHVYMAVLAASLFGVAIPVLAESAAVTSEATSQYLDDAALTARVKAALLADTSVSALDVSVSTQDGVVYLSGSTSETEKNHAQEIALSVLGVKDVKNNIQIAK